MCVCDIFTWQRNGIEESWKPSHCSLRHLALSVAFKWHLVEYFGSRTWRAPTHRHMSNKQIHVCVCMCLSNFAYKKCINICSFKQCICVYVYVCVCLQKHVNRVLQQKPAMSWLPSKSESESATPPTQSQSAQKSTPVACSCWLRFAAFVEWEINYFFTTKHSAVHAGILSRK